MAHVTVSRAFVIMRLFVGVAFAAVPGLALHGWLGTRPIPPTASVPLRAMGARDVALSLGALAAERATGDARPWLLAAGWCEAADAVPVLMVVKHLPPRQRVVASAGPAALAAVAVALAYRKR